jgi:hypothetical protein
METSNTLLSKQGFQSIPKKQLLARELNQT